VVRKVAKRAGAARSPGNLVSSVAKRARKAVQKRRKGEGY